MVGLLDGKQNMAALGITCKLADDTSQFHCHNKTLHHIDDGDYFSIVLAKPRPFLAAECGAIPEDSYLLTPVPQITPHAMYPNLASASTKYLNGYYTNLWQITIAPDARLRATATPLAPLPPSAT
jgi:hypothetical protein